MIWRSCSARSESAMFSGTLHVSHITSSSTSLKEAFGCAAIAVGASASSSRRPRIAARISSTARGRSPA
jgi:hypothetical protein